eukprot:6482061-Alexandrium_andersonii.AAC.1
MGVEPQGILHVAPEVAPPPPRQRTERAPRRVDITQATLGEHGRTAGCLKRNCVSGSGGRPRGQRRA